MRRKLFLTVLTVLALMGFFGCGADVTPVDESYEYSPKSKYYVEPAVIDGWAERDALTTTTEDGTFFCFTADQEQADDFVNAQRTLVSYLRSCGVEIGEMEFYGTDYGYSFSESGDNAAYVALSDVHTWQQVLVTLQAIWGDYTDYGYVYAMANAIAEELNWETDAKPSIENASMNAFFAENPGAIHLLYPTFTTKFASEETVENSKALANRLFEKINWRRALKKPIREQLDDYSALLSSYAQEISVPYTRQSCGYAYYGENVKLRILTTYAELVVDGNYRDIMENLYGDYWSDYASIYETANTINEEISVSVAYFGLEEEAGVATIKFVDSENSAGRKFTGVTGAMYWFSTKTAYTTSIFSYLHEYHHHIEGLLNPHNGQIWQSQVFCEIGNSRSSYPLYYMEQISREEKMAELFRACTGRTYQAGREDYFELWDILCYIDNDYDLDYYSRSPIDSFSGYMIGLCGEETTCQLLLFPETVEEVTGKTWEELEAEWKQHIQEKYAGVELPDWAVDTNS